MSRHGVGNPRLSVRVEPELLERIDGVGAVETFELPHPEWAGYFNVYPIGRSEAVRLLLVLGLAAWERGERIDE